MKTKTNSREAAETPLQSLLGTCKPNPIFAVVRDKKAGVILLYYGLELLERFPDRPDHFALRLCAGRLYNAGVKRKVLAETFGMDIRTIARIAEAMAQVEPDMLLEILRGRQRPRKLTPEIATFVRGMMETAFAFHSAAPSRYLRGMVQNVFGVSLSGETLRPLLAEYRKTRAAEMASDTRTSCDPPAGTPEERDSEQGVQNIDMQLDANIQDDAKAGEDASTDRKRSACSSPATFPRLLPHAGLFIFLPMLEQLAGVDAEDGGLLRQWAAGILLGAANLEQTKTLDHASMEAFLGPIDRKNPVSLRKDLHRVAARPGLRESMLHMNARLTGNTAPDHVYFDPHTKLYTGRHPILFGWVSSAKRVDKALHGDWFHGPDGSPLWHQLRDNYDDMRTTFLPAFRKMRKDLGVSADHTITVVIDRGIHGAESFANIAKEPGLALLTWDPVFQTGDENPPETGVERFELVRCRNHGKDKVKIAVEAWEVPHPSIAGAKRIVFRSVAKDGRVLKEAAILNIGAGVGVREAVELICQRWLQENDFKYQIDHFGMNELTSYVTKDYEKWAEILEDRPVPNGARQALIERTGELRKELGKVLVATRKSKRDLDKILKDLADMGEKLKTAEDGKSFASIRKQADRTLKRFDALYERTKEKHHKAGDLDAQLSKLQRQIKKLPREVSRLDQLIQEGKVRHDLAAKEFFDTVKMIARNMFYLRLHQFRGHYDNLRDDHVRLRNFSRSPGTLVMANGTPTLLMHPGFMSQGRKMRSVFAGYLRELARENEKNPYRDVRLVQSKVAFELAIKLCQNVQ